MKRNKNKRERRTGNCSILFVLQKERYQDKLTYEINIEDEQIKENLIPRLLIEPLVENAVSHGLEPKRKVES